MSFYRAVFQIMVSESLDAVALVQVEEIMLAVLEIYTRCVPDNMVLANTLR